MSNLSCIYQSCCCCHSQDDADKHTEIIAKKKKKFNTVLRLSIRQLNHIKKSDVSPL